LSCPFRYNGFAMTTKSTAIQLVSHILANPQLDGKATLIIAKNATDPAGETPCKWVPALVII